MNLSYCGTTYRTGGTHVTSNMGLPAKHRLLPLLNTCSILEFNSFHYCPFLFFFNNNQNLLFDLIEGMSFGMILIKCVCRKRFIWFQNNYNTHSVS